MMLAMSRSSRFLPAALLAVVVFGSAPPVHAQDSLGVAEPQRGRPTRMAVASGAGVPIWAFWLQQAWATASLAALLFAAYQLWARRGEQRKAEAEVAVVAHKAANYQAWQVVNSAQGKGGSGGRIDALQDLNRNAVSLAGVRLDGAWLTGIALAEAQLRHASLREANLSGADLRGANLENADLSDVNLTGADLKGAFLKGALVTGANLAAVDLRGADLEGLRDWAEIRSASYLNIEGVRHPPAGFRQWALEHGAIESEPPPEADSGEGYSSLFRTI
jgi:hypothetical protein